MESGSADGIDRLARRWGEQRRGPPLNPRPRVTAIQDRGRKRPSPSKTVWPSFRQVDFPRRRPERLFQPILVCGHAIIRRDGDDPHDRVIAIAVISVTAVDVSESGTRFNKTAVRKLRQSTLTRSHRHKRHSSKRPQYLRLTRAQMVTARRDRPSTERERRDDRGEATMPRCGAPRSIRLTVTDPSGESEKPSCRA